MATVLAQPHRRGASRPDDNRRHWAVGRLILDGKVRHPKFGPSALERAAHLYAAAYGDLRWVLDSKRPYWNSDGRAGLEPTEEKRVLIERAWGEVSRVTRDCGPVVRKALELAVLDNPEDERVLAPWIVLSLGTGLAALAQFFDLKALDE